MTSADVDAIVQKAHRRVDRLQQQLEAAKLDRSKVFALVQRDHGRSAGDISRLLGPGVTPDKVGYEIRVGRRLLRSKERSWS